MKVELKFITPNAEQFIGEMAAICYDGKLDEQSCLRRAAKCVDDGHLSTTRFAHAVFNVKGISRACSHQLVRHKFLDYLQRSQRYCKDVDASFVYPGTEQDTKISGAYQTAMSKYQELLDLGVKKEDARMILPAGITTEMNIVGSFQAWLDFIKLRADKHAQKEIRTLAKTINNILNQHCPNIFAWMP